LTPVPHNPDDRGAGVPPADARDLDTAPAQALRLKHFSTPLSVDVHCHCLPGLDDGPATLADAVALCEVLVADGFTHVVATPHQLGRYDGRNEPDQVRAAAMELRSALAERAIPLHVDIGADVRIDERLVPMFRKGQVLSVADNRRYLLLELPHEVFLDPRRVISDLRREGVTTILTHPERHPHLQRHPEAMLPWIEMGTVVQLTAGSVIGDFGATAQRVAWQMLQRGWVSIIATDAHDTVRRPPRMTAAADAIGKQFSHAVARRLCVENPARVLKGEPIVSFATRTVANPVAAPKGALGFAGLRPRQPRPAGGVR
jgi:protein-tyrosine phosphatase